MGDVTLILDFSKILRKASHSISNLRTNFSCPITDAFLSLDVLKSIIFTRLRRVYNVSSRFALVSPLYWVCANYLRQPFLISGKPSVMCSHTRNANARARDTRGE